MVSAQCSRILIVEDDEELALSLSNALALVGYQCSLAPSGSLRRRLTVDRDDDGAVEAIL